MTTSGHGAEHDALDDAGPRPVGPTDKPSWTRVIPIAAEGAPIVGTAFVLGLLLLALGPVIPHAPRAFQSLLSALFFAAPVVLVLGCFSLYFFRDPERTPPADPDAIVSAADGRVTAIENTADGLKISVFLSVFDVHVNRAPVAGRVVRTEYKPGEFLAAWKPLAEDVNERYSIEVETAHGRVEVIQVAGLIARRIVCRTIAGDVLRAGDPYGLIRFGSCTVVRLPAGTTPMVKLRQRVRGGETEIARWGSSS